ncbi:MAG TPA: class I SAM-dependent methyltransferase [Gemmatimonadaceae bacterium]
MDATWWIDALRSPRGQALLELLANESLATEAELGLITRLRRDYPAELVAAAITQARLRVRARAKFSRADRMLFTQAGLEQASSERMAAAHAARFREYSSVADLCTGIGGDLIALANGRSALGVDLDPVHARLAQINADVNGVGATASVVCADATQLRLDDIQAAFVDPARRSNDRRYRVGMSDPPLSWCTALADRGVAVGIKAAPGLPEDVVPDGWELEFVSERRELKESVLWSPRLTTARRRATLLPEGLTMTDEENVQLAVNAPGRYLLDPDPAVTRAGVVEGVGARLSERGDVWKIDEQIAFLSADFPMDTPFGRTLRIEASMPWNLGKLREALRSLDVGSVDIRKRGSAVDVEEVQKKLKLTGSRPATVALTRAAGKPWMLVCFAP